jgi:hypothetical protein
MVDSESVAVGGEVSPGLTDRLVVDEAGGEGQGTILARCLSLAFGRLRLTWNWPASSCHDDARYGRRPHDGEIARLRAQCGHTSVRKSAGGQDKETPRPPTVSSYRGVRGGPGAFQRRRMMKSCGWT